MQKASPQRSEYAPQVQGRRRCRRRPWTCGAACMDGHGLGFSPRVSARCGVICLRALAPGTKRAFGMRRSSHSSSTPRKWGSFAALSTGNRVGEPTPNPTPLF